MTTCQILLLRGRLVSVNPVIGLALRLGICLKSQMQVQCVTHGQAFRRIAIMWRLRAT